MSRSNTRVGQFRFPPTNPIQRFERLRVLIVEDDGLVRRGCETVAREFGFDAEGVGTVSAGRAVLSEKNIDVVLLDLRLGTESGLVLLKEIRMQTPLVSVVVMTAFATVGSAVEALRAGATDYIQKPFSVEELIEVLESAAHQATRSDFKKNISEQLCTDHGSALLAGRSPRINKLRRLVSRVAVSNHPVLMLGEPGTEKESVARSIHMESSRSLEPFVPVECSAFPPDKLESLLFGDVAALKERSDVTPCRGLVAESGGTVFLNEIDCLASGVQSRLVSAIEKGIEVRSAIVSKMTPIATRILASSSNNLEELVNLGRFRKDLFRRLALVTLDIPPLRERRCDIPELSTLILTRLSRNSNRSLKFGRTVIRRLMEYDWPGNVAELESTIEYATVVSEGPELYLSDFPKHIQEHTSNLSMCSYETSQQRIESELPQNPSQYGRPIAEMEREAILNAVSAAQWRQAARGGGTWNWENDPVSEVGQGSLFLSVTRDR